MAQCTGCRDDQRAFGTVVEEQPERLERLKQEGDSTDYGAISPIVIGMTRGDGIGPTISEETQRILEYLLRDQVEAGKVNLRVIEGLTIENRAQYADPNSLLRAGAMMLEHIGLSDLDSRLHRAIDICGQYERKIVMTGRNTGSTSKEFGDYLTATVEDPNVDSRWKEYVGEQD